jgi:molybdate transport system permease protein
MFTGMETVWIPLWLSLKVAGCATAINLVLGTALGWWLARKPFWGRGLVEAVLTLLVLVGQRGPLGAWLLDTFGLRLVFTWQGAVLAATLVAFPLVLKSARAAFEGVDPQLEKAARVLGLGEAAVFFRVSLPLAWRGILAGVLLAFARALGEFGATLMIAGSIPGQTQTLAIAVYEAVQAGQDAQAHFLVVVTSLVCLAVLLSAGRLAPGRVAQ